MKHSRDLPQFYLTAPAPCPYLDTKLERKVFTHLVGARAPVDNNALTLCGFRRSQNIAYRPACEDCNACVSVRVLVNEFSAGRSFRRNLKLNSDVVAHLRPPEPTGEQYGLFRAYLDARHTDGGMADMSVLDFAAMIEDTAVDTRIIEYRQAPVDAGGKRSGTRPLVAVSLVDILSDGLSMVYSFFDPELPSRSLGTYMILWQIERAWRLNLPYVYLGYWIKECGKMRYKTDFRPLELLLNEKWVLLT